jgi:oligopeptide/dipeptide ABC transporter ATP-binding protein
MATIFICTTSHAAQRSRARRQRRTCHRKRADARLSAHPRHPYTAELIAATPGSTASLEELHAIPGASPDLRRTDLPPCRYSERCPRKIDACAQPLPLPGANVSHSVRCWNSLPEKTLVAAGESAV